MNKEHDFTKNDNLINKNGISGITVHLFVYYLWNTIVLSIFFYFIKNLLETVAKSQYEKMNLKQDLKIKKKKKN